MKNKKTIFSICRRILGTAVLLSILLAQLSYASSVVTAGSPTDNGTGAITSSSAGTDSTLSLHDQIEAALASGARGFISSTGPTGSSSGTSSTAGNSSSSSTTGSTSGASSASSGSLGTTGPGVATGTETTGTGTTTQTGPGDTTTSGTTTQGSPGSTGYINIDNSIASPTVLSDYAILYDATNGQVFYEKNADTPTPPASTAKFMTALIVLEQYANTLSNTITFSQSVINSLESGATTARMRAGDTLTVEQALNAILVGSSCDVAAQLATSLAGSESAFAALMTARARELGCTSTNFVNATGLNSDSQYTTARDMARITFYALSNETIRNIVMQHSYTLPATSSRGSLTLTNTNHFTAGTESAPTGYIAGKTGYTSLAGHCLGSMALIDGHYLIAVILHASGSNHYTDTRSLYQYGKALLDAAGLGGDSTATGTTAGSTGTGTSSGTSTTASTTDGTWEQLSDGHYRFRKTDGSYCVSEWLDKDGETYFFDPDGIMVTGWQRFSNGTYYYFNPENGAMVREKWVTQNGRSYYMSATGVMATNTIIDGKYRVDADGVYVEQVG